MPGSIKVSDVQPPVATPLFLQVAVGKKEYSGNIGQDGFSFPVTSLRDSMVMTLYDADKELVSKTDVNAKAVVELGTMEVIFTLDSGGTIILQLQFLLSDEDRKRVQEMRNSAMKRKQQELLGNGHGLYSQDSILPKEQKEEVADIGSKGDQLTLRKSMSVDDLEERDAFSVPSVALSEQQTEEIPGIPSKGGQLTLRKSLSLDDLKEGVDSGSAASKDLLLQSGGNTSKLEGPIDIESKKGQGKRTSRSSSAVKKMISAFESSSPQGPPSVPRIKSESLLSVSSETSTNYTISPPTLGAPLNVSVRTSGKETIPSADTGSSSRSGKQVMFGNKKTDISRQTRVSNSSESRRRSSSRQDRRAKTSAGENDSTRSEQRSQEKHRHRSVGAYSPEQQQKTNRVAAASSITWIHPHLCITTASRQLKYLVNLEHLNSVKSVEENERDSVNESQTGDDMRDAAVSARQSPLVNGWLINQGVRAVIVVIACGAVFLNNR
ncbi:unnamed protein product [Alopecurus aequalis]